MLNMKHLSSVYLWNNPIVYSESQENKKLMKELNDNGVTIHI